MPKVTPLFPSTPDAGAELLRALLEEVLTLHQKVDRLLAAHDSRDQAPAALALKDHVLLAPLLPLIGQHLGDETFSVASLMQAVVEANDETLAAALDGCGSTRAIGKLFARAAGQDVCGWRVDRVSPLGPSAALWHVSNISQT